jgi:transketolase
MQSNGRYRNDRKPQQIGGLFSAVSDVLARKCPTPAEYVAVEDEFGEVGPQDYLQKRFGLTADNIVAKVKAVLARK